MPKIEGKDLQGVYRMLVEAREYLRPRERWWSGNGNTIGDQECAVTVLLRVSGYHRDCSSSKFADVLADETRRSADRFLSDASFELFDKCPVAVNDKLGHDAVLGIYDRAIEIVRNAILADGGTVLSSRRGDHAAQEVSMCDYSLESQKRRDAVVGDRLELSAFPLTTTRGFIDASSCADGFCAVCLKPGTEVVFDEPPQYRVGSWGVPEFKTATGKTAIFKKVDAGQTAHHDALEFEGGLTVMVTTIQPGAQATVLQLGIDEAKVAEQDRRLKEAAPETAPAAEGNPYLAFAARMNDEQH